MKYLTKPAIVPGQEREIFPIMDTALQLPYGKAVAYPCVKSRANYLYRIIQGERYRNAVESIATYTPDDYLYGRGLYYHLVPDVRLKGLILANVENPPNNVTWDIIRCAATKKPVELAVSVTTAQNRLNKLKAKFPNELGVVYINNSQLCYAVPSPEEFVIVDIDVGSKVLPPTFEQRAKLRQ